MEKMEYTKPSAEIVRFQNEDIITKSCTGPIYDFTGWSCLSAGVLSEGGDGAGEMW